jgi:5'(3')-deoxyribonucleotidase
MTKPVIAVDVDDVLAVHAEEVIDFSNKVYGTNLTIEDYDDKHWTVMWQIERKESEERTRAFHDARMNTLSVIAGADKVLQGLAQKYTLVVVTARPPYLEEVTRTWLGQYYKNLFSDYRFVNAWGLHNQKTVSKAEVCSQIGAQYLIDDSLKHASLAANAGIQVLLYGDYPWLRGVSLRANMVRVKTWNEIGKYFHV